MNPCGAVMDLGRRTFTQRCRFFRDSDEEAHIVWYPALPGAKTFPTENLFSNEDTFEQDPWIAEGTGPIWYTKFRNSRKAIPGALGTHQCGTAQDFAEGCLYLPAEPPVVYTPTGLPTCCNPAVVPKGGGVGGGKSSTWVGYPPDAVGGGGEGGGEIAETRIGTDAVAGGGEGGGEIAEVYTPGAAPPTATCAAAGTLVLGTEYTFTIGTTETQWWKFPVANGVQYHIQTTNVGFGSATFIGNHGSSCAGLSPLSYSVTGPDCWEFTSGATDNVYLTFTGNPMSPETYTVIVDAGAC